MSRQPFEFNLDKGDRVVRVLYTPSTYESSNPAPHYRANPARLRVEYDPDWGLVEIADEDVTSESKDAQPLDGGKSVAIRHELTTDEVAWLHRQLGELIERIRLSRLDAAADGKEAK